MQIRTLWLALSISLASAVVAPALVDAQPKPAPAPNVAQNRREAIKKKIRAMRAYTLTEELALDEQTAGKLFPALARWDDVTDKLLVQRADIHKRLAGVASIKDPKAADKLVDEAVANQKAFWDLEDKRLAELRKILTPAQTARLLVVLPTFERRIQNQIKRAIDRRQGAGNAVRGRNRPAIPDDEDDE